MIYKTIQGEEVPALGLGTWQLAGADCREAVRHALTLGYRHIDTAQAYNNEEQVGAGLQDAGVDRDDVFLTTKVWPDNLAPGNVQRSTEKSIQQLQTDYVDLLLVHWPAGDLDLEATLDAFAALQDEGTARHIGVSNFPPDLLERALAHTSLFCIQVEYHPFLSQQALLALARKHDLLFTAYSPLARGKVLDDELLQALADAHDKSPAQLALRWLVQQRNVAAIPKSSSAEHRESNLDIFDFELSEEEMNHLFNLARGERLVEPSGVAPETWEH